MKNKDLFLLIVMVLFFTSRHLWAQNATQSVPQGAGHYVIEQRYVLQLVWIGGEYTSKYEVVIERITDKESSVYLQKFTEKPTLEISLPPGNYRYRVIPYDYLDQIGEPSKWVTFEIKPAPIVPVEVQTENGSYIIRSYNNEKIVPDANEIVIKNPNAFEKENGVMVVDEKTESSPPKMFSFFVSAAWSPLIPLHGRMKNAFGIAFYASGASLHFGVFYNKPDWWIIPGVELSASWSALNNVDGDNEISIQAGMTGINFIAQKQFFNRMAVNVKAGFALNFLIGDVISTQYKYSIGGVSPQINLEASFLWFAWKQLYIEAGINYSVFLLLDNNSGYLHPYLGIGWKF